MTAAAQDSVKLFTDGHVGIEWGVIGDDFAKNQARLRYEVAVTQPAGVFLLATATPATCERIGLATCSLG